MPTCATAWACSTVRCANRFRFRSRAGLLSSLACFATACVQRQYQEPALPHAQMALVTVEERAVVRAVDGAEPYVVNGQEERIPLRRFWISPSCHELLVHYKEEYVRAGGAALLLTWSPAALAAGFALTAASIAANTKTTTYRTEEPIRSYIPARSGGKYWITSTFTGEVFMPRVAVLNEAEERVDVILPNQPCAAKASGTASAAAGR
jgi:hypothetical protein